MNLKSQIEAKQREAEGKITEILKDFLDITGYVPVTINVHVIETSGIGDKDPVYIINGIDLSTGL